MRHRKKGRKLNRTASHKKAMLRNLANQLFEHKEIRTTTAKAKEARPTVERLITYAKKGDLHHRRLAFSFLRQKSSIKTLFDEIAPTFDDRQGGYTRVIKLGRRLGDGAQMSILQLVGFETLGEVVKKETKKKTKKKEAKKEEAPAAEESVAVAATPVVENETGDSDQKEDEKVEVKDAGVQEPVVPEDETSTPEEMVKDEKSTENEQTEVEEKKPDEELKTDNSEESESDKKK